jgi:hypothetical protein
VRKLGFAPGMRAHYANAPEHFAGLVGELPDGVRILSRPAAELDLAMLFVTERRVLARGLRTLQPKLRPAGMIWVAWPKKASKVPTDVTEDVVREVALPRGLVDVKVCAIDEVWSGLKLVVRKELREQVPQRRSTPDAVGRAEAEEVDWRGSAA